MASAMMAVVVVNVKGMDLCTCTYVCMSCVCMLVLCVCTLVFRCVMCVFVSVYVVCLYVHCTCVVWCTPLWVEVHMCTYVYMCVCCRGCLECELPVAH